MSTRKEADSIGSKDVKVDAYYGIQSLRAAENFRITRQMLHPAFINAMAMLKKASALTNMEAGVLEENKADAIMQACREIIEGQFHNHFITDAIQGGAGTSMNMNANEVIANRADEILGGIKGEYKHIHPNDHVNMGQSTNDVIPSSGKLATLILIKPLINELIELQRAFKQKGREFNNVIKVGRTQLQDAVPIRLGQEFEAYAAVIARDIKRVRQTIDDLRFMNMGGTAVGTGLNADIYYVNKIALNITKVTGIDVYQSDNLIDATQNLDSFVWVSAAIKTCAINLSKIANDLRLMSSGPRNGFGEINLPQVQPGSSIMPGKVNPVIPEVVNQVSFLVIGNDQTITMAAESGQLELNAFEPVLFNMLFQSIELMTNAVNTFRENCIKGITANKEYCYEEVENSIGIVTALVPHIGYKKSSEIAKKSLKTGKKIRDLILEEKILSPQELSIILNPINMTEPGISGKAMLERFKEEERMIAELKKNQCENILQKEKETNKKK
jgi:aspartate ammonia-lyase